MSTSNEQVTENNTAEEKGASSANMSAMIDGILANPELIATVASALGPMLKEQSSKSEAPSDAVSSISNNVDNSTPTSSSVSDIGEKLPDFAAAIAPILSSMQKGSLPTSVKSGPSNDRRSCLLLALKPYLCRERCEAIDYMIKLGKLSDVFRSLS